LFETDTESENLDEDKEGEIKNNDYLDDKDYILDDNKLEGLLEDNLNEDSDLKNKDVESIEIVEENLEEIDKEIIEEKLDEIKDDCITPRNNMIKD
jgi:hypothetical protein